MRMTDRRRLPRTINDLVREGGTPPEGSMLEAAMNDNPYLGHAPDPKREYSDAQLKLLLEMLRTRPDISSKRTRRRTLQFSDRLAGRLDYFLKEYPAFRQSSVISFAIARLLDDLGE
jgi:hypothetical protein